MDENVKIIGSAVNGYLQKIEIENNKVTVKKEEIIKVFDLSLLPNWDLLLSTWEDKLQLYTKDGRLILYKDFHPLLTMGEIGRAHV